MGSEDDFIRRLMSEARINDEMIAFLTEANKELRRVVAELQRDAAAAPTEAGQGGEVEIFGNRIAISPDGDVRYVFGGVE